MRIIRASEIGEFIFCRRAWWLRHVQGRASANIHELAAGTAVHARHGRAVWLSGALRLAAVLLLALAAIACLISLLPRY